LYILDLLKLALAKIVHKLLIPKFNQKLNLLQRKKKDDIFFLQLGQGCSKIWQNSYSHKRFKCALAKLVHKLSVLEFLQRGLSCFKVDVQKFAQMLLICTC
jgi:hypothetical protein